LGLGVLQDYNRLRADTQAKNIAAWTPVVAEILDGFCRFDDKAVRTNFQCFSTCVDASQFARYLPAIYPLATDLLARDVAPEIRSGLKTYFVRVGVAQGILEAS
jgi:brefeldin A-inhibited guanine nucleotide-exchange protein